MCTRLAKQVVSYVSAGRPPNEPANFEIAFEAFFRRGDYMRVGDRTMSDRVGRMKRRRKGMEAWKLITLTKFGEKLVI